MKESDSLESGFLVCLKPRSEPQHKTDWGSICCNQGTWAERLQVLGYPQLPEEFKTSLA